MSTAPASLPGFSVGEVVAGRYRIESLLGEGGYGAVLAATQLDTERTVALKVLMPELCEGEAATKRFEREARLIHQLEHPNTVRLFDFGRTEAGVPFLVLEHLRGRPLSAVIRTEPLPAHRVARIAKQVLKSLMEAHAVGIVHRDVKPANIFLCDVEGEPDFVKLLDFGVAKSFLPDRSASTALTQQGHAVGTPHYMAPEQVMGRSVGPPTDLYSLGLVMAEALTGERVMKGSSGLEICMQQLSADPVPLSAAVAADVLGPVIVRATEKRYDRRFGSAAEMLAAIEALHGAVRVEVAEPPTTPVETRPCPAPAWPFPAPIAPAPAPIASPTPQPRSPETREFVAALRVLPAPAPPPPPPPAHLDTREFVAALRPLGGALGSSPPVASETREFFAAVRPPPRRRRAALVAGGVLVLAGGAALWGGWSTEPDAPPTTAASPSPAATTPTTPLIAIEPAAEPTTAPTATGFRPAGPSRPSFNERAATASVDALAPLARACNKGPAQSVIVSVRFHEAGDAFAVTLSVVGGGSPYTGTPVGNCMVSRFLQARVQPFKADNGEFRAVFQTYSL